MKGPVVLESNYPKRLELIFNSDEDNQHFSPPPDVARMKSQHAIIPFIIRALHPGIN